MDKLSDIVKKLEKRIKEATTAVCVGTGGKVISPLGDKKKKKKRKMIRNKVGYV